MKKLILLFASLTLACHAADEYRTFTAQDGRTLKAKIITYDDSTGKVQIQREDSTLITANRSAFSKKDQTYIKTWSATGVFTSTSKLKAEVKRNIGKPTKKEIEVDMSTQTGRGSRGGGTQVVATDKKTSYKFDLLLENKGDISLTNIKMEYRIFYNQEKPIEDEKANAQRDENDTRPERYLALDEDKVKSGEARLKSIGAGESETLSTGSVSILKRSANRTWGSNINLKGDLAGVWFKLTMRAPDGTQLIREIAQPESIRKKYSWDVEETQEDDLLDAEE